MISCRRCGRQLPENARFCDRCGLQDPAPIRPAPAPIAYEPTPTPIEEVIPPVKPTKPETPPTVTEETVPAAKPSARPPEPEISKPRVRMPQVQLSRRAAFAVLIIFILIAIGAASALRSATTTTRYITNTLYITTTHKQLVTSTKTITQTQIQTVVSAATKTELQCKGNAKCWEGTVTKIVDGDTLDVDQVRIRLALVDTPEKNQPGGPEAAEFVAKLCPVDSRAVVDQDDKQLIDPYDRMLAAVWCSGKNLNAELLYAGVGHIDTKFCVQSEFQDEEWAKNYGC